MADLQRVVELGSTETNVVGQLSDLYLESGQILLAVGVLNDAIDAGNAHPRLLTARGKIHRSLGDMDAARSDFDRAIDANPRFANAYAERGALSAIPQRQDAAMADYAMAIRLDPTHWHALVNRAQLRRDRQDYKGDVADLDRALALNPTDVSLLMLRGSMNQMIGEPGAAVRDWWQAMELAGGIVIGLYKARASAAGHYDGAIDEVLDEELRAALLNCAQDIECGPVTSATYCTMATGEECDLDFTTITIMPPVAPRERRIRQTIVLW